MHDFANGSLAAFEDLGARCRSHCVTFTNQALPLGCTPERARIGFEATPGGAAPNGIRLLIDENVRYSGRDAHVQQWVSDGYLDFASPATMHEWCSTELRPLLAAQTSVAANDANSGDNAPAQAPARTDMQEVQRQLSARSQQNRSALITPDALASALGASIKGQTAALAAVAARVSAHVNRSHPRKPASLFFVGPTGTGKTRTASKLADTLKAQGLNGMRYLRLDMNEYQESHRISQLLGSPQGYAGYGEGAQLVKQLSEHPRSVVLFDEIEKAHPSILLALMNAMDAGRLSRPTAFNGSYEIDCRQALFVFTSNMDAEGILDELEHLPDATQQVIDELCRKRLTAQGLRPELAARISTYAVFKPLGEAHRLEVVLSAIQDVAAEYGMQVREVAPEIVAEIVSGGDGQFGVRADEYRIDSLLGLCLAQAARAGLADIDLQGLPPRATATATATAMPAALEPRRLPATGEPA